MVRITEYQVQIYNPSFKCWFSVNRCYETLKKALSYKSKVDEKDHFKTRVIKRSYVITVIK